MGYALAFGIVFGFVIGFALADFGHWYIDIFYNETPENDEKSQKQGE